MTPAEDIAFLRSEASGLRAVLCPGKAEVFEGIASRYEQAEIQWAALERDLKAATDLWWKYEATLLEQAARLKQLEAELCPCWGALMLFKENQRK